MIETITPIPLRDGRSVPAGAVARWVDGRPDRVTVTADDGTAATIRATTALRAAGIEIPDVEALEEWAHDTVCETPTGDTVEPDGYGPDGAPSWLLILGLI